MEPGSGSERGAAPRLLVIGGGVEAVPGLERLLELGARMAVVDADPRAPGFDLAEHRLELSTYAANQVAEAAAALEADFPIQGVLSIACDVPHTVAAVADRLKLPGISRGTARLCMDKLAMKRRFLQAGVPVPWFEPLESEAQLDELVARHGTVIVKPVDSRGARGVLRVDAAVDTHWAVAHAREASPCGRAMIEQYLDGPQISSESIVLDERVWTLGCSDRNYARLDEFAPHVIEDGGCQPSVHLDQILSEVDDVILRAARAIGMSRGALKGDLVLTPGRGPVVIEVAPRLSGGWFCTDQIPLSTGVDLVQMQARIALGETPTDEELTPGSWAPIAVRYAFPGEGRVRAVHGIDALRAEPWCQRVHLFARPGDVLRSPRAHTGRAAVVLATGPTRREAVARAEDGVARISFDLDPLEQTADAA